MLGGAISHDECYLVPQYPRHVAQELLVLSYREQVMTLMDDVARVVSVEGIEAKVVAMLSAHWIYERNPTLSLDEQAEGFAFLVADYLRATDADERRNWLYILQKISKSRPHHIGSQVDWDAFARTLPTLVEKRAMHVALVLLCDANDARYLSVLEDYFDHPDHCGQAFTSWIALAYTERYTFDKRVFPYLHEAERIIGDRFAAERTHRRGEERASVQRTDPLVVDHPWTPVFPEARAWAMQQFALADERIRQEIQVRDCRVSQKADEGGLLTFVQQQLAAPLSRREYNSKMVVPLLDTLTHNESFPIDGVARMVKVLVDSALESEEHRFAWAPIAVAFETRRYVGTYLDWDRLVALLPSLDADRSDPKRDALRGVLGCLSNASEERFLDILQPYLDHPDHDVRVKAADCIDFLLRHLAHHCPEVIFLARQIMEGVSPDHSETPEAWQRLKERLARLAHEARPYFHYYSI